MQNVIFIEKYPSEENPWIKFGSSEKEYKKWIPHVCGICCLKMIGDTLRLTTSETLYSLTIGCYSMGGFKFTESGKIIGVFHYNLLDFAKSLGLDGHVEKDLSSDIIKDALSKGRFVILSIDLLKVTNNHIGSHLILLHTYDKNSNSFIVHDSANTVAKIGKNAVISINQVEYYSNRKGVILYK